MIGGQNRQPRTVLSVLPLTHTHSLKRILTLTLSVPPCHSLARPTCVIQMFICKFYKRGNTIMNWTSTLQLQRTKPATGGVHKNTLW